ncbi:MAG: peptide chain release factor N(5)-glutamine methyltransferase [Chthoniobacterales bacterium]
MTVLELLQSTSEYFARKGIDQPRLNIEHLLADSLGKKRIELYLEFDRQLKEAELAPLRERVRRRAEGEPLQHLLGSWDFYGRPFKTDRRALIPRPETELLVEVVLDQLKGAPKEGTRLIDVGTGCGILAITFALEIPQLKITAVDVSTDALALARENAASFGLESNIDFVQSNLVHNTEGLFHWVVANLPYIPTAELDALQREVKHDPRVALDGGLDGLVVIRNLVCSLPTKLAPGALIALEVGRNQAEPVRELFAGQNYRDISVRNDYQGVQRVVRARYG